MKYSLSYLFFFFRVRIKKKCSFWSWHYDRDEFGWIDDWSVLRDDSMVMTQLICSGMGKWDINILAWKKIEAKKNVLWSFFLIPESVRELFNRITFNSINWDFGHITYSRDQMTYHLVKYRRKRFWSGRSESVMRSSVKKSWVQIDSCSTYHTIQQGFL